ncbi:chaperone activator [Ephemerocybe angulata]|uniref:Chaperone activator n=1 Tax=Ephemerocybe angulata TaxID=980116 RepID=A0A8H6MCS0_9AGAR|nr:chaperone activator [Tulosesus angulatus]
MALPPSTANWHWKNKNVTPWAKEWITRELTGLSVSGDKEGETASVSQVTSVEGDVEIGQRKSKLLTIFDCDVRLEWIGTTSSGEEVKGSLHIPEVSHEIICDGLSEFVFQWSLDTASSPEVDAVYKLARTKLQGAIETKLSSLARAIIDTHGKDIQVSGTSTPTNAASGPSTPTAAATPDKAVTVSNIVVEATFQASGDDLFSLLTDEKRIPAWTRNSAVSQAKPDTEYSLFGGGVKGKYISLTQGKEIVQTWALSSPTWPSGHAATLTTTLDQGSDSTKVKFSLAGVPLGMEDEIRRNIEGYYVHGFKSIGLGTEL